MVQDRETILGRSSHIVQLGSDWITCCCNVAGCSSRDVSAASRGHGEIRCQYYELLRHCSGNSRANLHASRHPRRLHSFPPPHLTWRPRFRHPSTPILLGPIPDRLPMRSYRHVTLFRPLPPTVDSCLLSQRSFSKNHRSRPSVLPHLLVSSGRGPIIYRYRPHCYDGTWVSTLDGCSLPHLLVLD